MPLTATGSVKKLVVQSDLYLTSPTSGIKLRLAETVCIVSHVINSNKKHGSDEISLINVSQNYCLTFKRAV